MSVLRGVITAATCVARGFLDFFFISFDSHICVFCLLACGPLVSGAKRTTNTSTCRTDHDPDNLDIISIVIVRFAGSVQHRSNA